jgi:hypothetical protein
VIGKNLAEGITELKACRAGADMRTSDSKAVLVRYERRR